MSRKTKDESTNHIDLGQSEECSIVEGAVEHLGVLVTGLVEVFNHDQLAGNVHTKSQDRFITDIFTCSYEDKLTHRQPAFTHFIGSPLTYTLQALWHLNSKL